KAYLFEPLAFLQKEFNLGQYGLGYAYFEKKDYQSAETWFRKVVAHNNETDTLRIADAYLRIGDAFFIRKAFDRCAEFYDQAIALNRIDADYALYQKAMALGIYKSLNDKITVLEELISKFPTTKYADVTKYQLGRTHLITGNESQALTYLKKVVEDHPNSIYVKKSMVSIGLIHYNRKENDQA